MYWNQSEVSGYSGCDYDESVFRLFSETEIIHILKEVQGGLNPDGSIFILETYWDRQKFEISAFVFNRQAFTLLP
jgi:hypothetical protein